MAKADLVIDQYIREALAPAIEGTTVVRIWPTHELLNRLSSNTNQKEPSSQSTIQHLTRIVTDRLRPSKSRDVHRLKVMEMDVNTKPVS